MRYEMGIIILYDIKLKLIVKLKLFAYVRDNRIYLCHKNLILIIVLHHNKYQNITQGESFFSFTLHSPL